MPLLGFPAIPELILILGVVLLLFGGKKLPQLGGAIGESIRNFKKGVKDDNKELPGSPTPEATDRQPNEKE